MKASLPRPAGMIVLHLAAAPSLVKKHPVAKKLADLKSWPWISLDGFQFWSAKEITLFARHGAEQTLRISPILISEGLTSIREATRAGLGIAILPDWLIDEDLRSKRPGARSAAVENEGSPAARRLRRTTPFAGTRERPSSTLPSLT